MAHRLTLVSVLGLILGIGAVQSASATSVRDSVGLRKCLGKTHAAFRNDADCLGFLERRGISHEVMDMMKSCIATHKQYVNLVEECQPLVAQYPGIMLTPYGSSMSPGGTDVSDR